MLNFILGPLGILLIGFGVVGLFWALRKSRAGAEADVVEADPADDPHSSLTLPDDSRN